MKSFTSFFTATIPSWYAALKVWYATLTPAQKARAWSLLITGLSMIASVGDKITPVPGLPGWVANAWPVIFSTDMVILKLINVFTNPNAVANPPAVVPAKAA